MKPLGDRMTWLDCAARHLSGAEPLAIASLVEVEGSAPLGVGAAMLVTSDGKVEGSVTGGCVEAAVAAEALEVLGGAPSRVSSYGISDELAGSVGLTCGGVVHVYIRALDDETRRVTLAAYEAALEGRPAALATILDGPAAGEVLALVGDYAFESGKVAPTLAQHISADLRGMLERGVTTTLRYGHNGRRMGVDVRVHMEVFAKPPQMLIFGANDFSAALAPLAAELGYRVTICDAREPFLASPRYARAAETLVAWPQQALAEADLDAADAVVVLTHDAKFDEPALLGALETPVGYIGALGSRRTASARAQRLRASGVSDDDLARIHAPCGLDIGSSTAAESALAILAEIVANRTGRSGESLTTCEGAIRGRSARDSAVDRQIVR